MIMSRIDCSIVTVQADGTSTSGMARTLLYHNGLAMPQGKRGQEIIEEVAQAVGGQMKLAANHVAVVTTGASGKYFRPSLMPVVEECVKQGVLVLTANGVLRLLPPLNIPMEVLAKAIKIVKEIIEK